MVLPTDLSALRRASAASAARRDEILGSNALNPLASAAALNPHLAASAATMNPAMSTASGGHQPHTLASLRASFPGALPGSLALSQGLHGTTTPYALPNNDIVDSIAAARAAAVAANTAPSSSFLSASLDPFSSSATLPTQPQDRWSMSAAAAAPFYPDPTQGISSSALGTNTAALLGNAAAMAAPPPVPQPPPPPQPNDVYAGALLQLQEDELKFQEATLRKKKLVLEQQKLALQSQALQQQQNNVYATSDIGSNPTVPTTTVQPQELNHQNNIAFPPSSSAATAVAPQQQGTGKNEENEKVNPESAVVNKKPAASESVREDRKKRAVEHTAADTRDASPAEEPKESPAPARKKAKVVPSLKLSDLLSAAKKRKPTSDKVITEVTDKDVLSCRSRRGNNPPGNQAFHKTCKEFHDFYTQASSRIEKAAVSSFIVNAVHSGGGRFLRRVDCENDLAEEVKWVELSYEEAQQKTRDALKRLSHAAKQNHAKKIAAAERGNCC